VKPDDEGKRTTPWPSLVRRIVHSVRIVAKRLRRGGARRGRAWDGTMTWIALGGLVVVVLASFMDAWAIRFARTSQWPAFGFLRLVTDVALVQWYLVPAGLVVLSLSMMDWSGRGSRRQARLALVFGQAVFAIAAIGFAQLLTRVLKLVVGRARPELIDPNGAFQFDFFQFGELYWSFPSGHATTSGALTAILLLWFPRARLAVLPVGMTLALSRVAADAHYPSDVAAGFLVGFVVALFLARWLAFRGLVFRFRDAGLLPRMRFVRGQMPDD
jgi:undecaprenyl-diphosphatase